jgi:cyclohexa-1,5-dienecarbonyl-CoA hydratase
MIGALQAALDAHRPSAGAACAACCSTPRARTSASAPASRSTWPSAAPACWPLHALILAMAEYPVPILVAVRGQCLGGGLEIALAGGPIFARTDAAASASRRSSSACSRRRLRACCPGACSPAWPRTCCGPGRSVTGSEALAIGLVHALADDPEAAALAYFDEHLAPKSAAALALRCGRARAPRVRELRQRLAEVERLYLDR